MTHQKFLAATLFATLVLSAAADSSRDEQITGPFAEGEAGMPRVAANFKKIDADQSGTVPLAEIEALADRRSARTLRAPCNEALPRGRRTGGQRRFFFGKLGTGQLVMSPREVCLAWPEGESPLAKSKGISA